MHLEHGGWQRLRARVHKGLQPLLRAGCAESLPGSERNTQMRSNLGYWAASQDFYPASLHVLAERGDKPNKRRFRPLETPPSTPASLGSGDHGRQNANRPPDTRCVRQPVRALRVGSWRLPEQKAKGDAA
jgi:hypothetical protein